MYETLARYYDQLHAGLTADIPFVLRAAQEFGGPVLELGCGSGRLLIPLAQAGYHVTGVDNSAAMLALAREKVAALPSVLQDAVTLLQADMRRLPPSQADKAYGLVILPYNTLHHFPQAEVGPLLHGLFGQMWPNGGLLIDGVNPLLLEALDAPPEPEFETSFSDPQTGARVEQWSQSEVDREAQTLTVRWSFSGAEAGVMQDVIEVVYHYLYPHQLLPLVQKAGFRIRHVWGNYDGAPFAEDSERLLIVATAVN